LLRLRSCDYDENFNPNSKQSLVSDALASFDLSDVKQSIAVLQQQLLMKSNIVDVCALVDMKADTSEMTRVVEEIQEVIQSKYE
jgi:hypothetical protein